ncbi:MAG: glycosyltransferase [Anaerolineae bacterium]|nr:glycosyltransferase [Anaerolineae bacterium]
MKLLVVMPYYKPAYVYGGPTRSVSMLCEALVQLGVQVSVLTTNANGNQRLAVPLGEPVNLNGVEVTYYPLASPSLGSFFYSPELVQACIQKLHYYDIVDLEVFWTHAAGPVSRACQHQGIPYLFSLRGQLLPWALRRSHLKKQLFMMVVGRHFLNEAAALHATDLSEATSVRKLNFTPEIFIVPNGIDTSYFAQLPKRGQLLRKLGIPENAFVILFLGRLHPIKRPDIAIEVLARLQSDHPNLHLILVGPDEATMSSSLQAQARILGCSERVHLLGLLEGKDRLQAFADADLLLGPTEVQENFGMAAAEALAAGVPILVSTGVPVGYWAQQAGAGRQVPCTIEDFTLAAKDMLSDPPRLKQYAHQGRNLAKKKFDISAVAQEMLTQYQAIISLGHPITNLGSSS